jgi:acyl dehydratase
VQQRVPSRRARHRGFHVLLLVVDLAMAFTGGAVLEAIGISDPGAARRLAARFSAPLFPGEQLTTRGWAVDGGYGFEALSSSGSTVIKDGRLELRRAS